MGKTKSFCVAVGCLIMGLYAQGCTPQVRYSRSPQNAAAGAERKKQEKNTPRRFSSQNNPAASSSRLTHVVKSYIGIPYRWGGTTRAGFDCSGFVGAVFRDLHSIELPRTSRAMSKLGKRVRKDNLRTADLIFFRGGVFRRINHVGIYMGDGRFVHSSTKKGVTYSSVDNVYFKKNFAFGRRLF